MASVPLPLVVVALGGNALLRRGKPATAADQLAAAREVAAVLAPVSETVRLVVTHGSGPQVGLLALKEEAYPDGEPYPLDMLDAGTAGQIGYVVELALDDAIAHQKTATVITRVLVDADDPAFDRPTKFIGPVYREVQAKVLATQRGWTVAPDGTSWRRVVASPEPLEIVSLPAVRHLVDGGFLVVCVGGGGVPVVGEGAGHVGVEAVVDKDLASALLAVGLGADVLVLATDVDAVYADWGGPYVRAFGATSPAELRGTVFAEGSMGPKVEAVCRFVEATGGRGAIGSVADLAGLVDATAGTQVRPDGHAPGGAERPGVPELADATGKPRVPDALVAALLADGRGPVERRDTHCSSVLLTPTRAYKRKKAVRFDFVDQRDLRVRRDACEREARLNQELAPGLVLGVRGVAPTGDGTVRLVGADAPGVVDWVIEMTRFDERDTLEARLRDRRLAPASPGAVGRRLAAFHRDAVRLERADGVLRVVEENLDALAVLLGDDGVVHGLRRFVGSWSDGPGRRWALRGDSGRVVDGHGDLRAEHVLLDTHGIRFVDRLEIDALRAVDVADDLAFLLMDLERLGAPEVGAEVLAGYRSRSDEETPDDLLAFFGVHRAAVRAKVALLRGGDGAEAEAREGLALARRLAWRARNPMVLLVTGPPATGKSTLARAIAEASGLPVVSSDVVRKEPGAAPPSYDGSAREAVYAELGRRVGASRPSVVVDATFGDPGLQRAFFDAVDAVGRRPVLVVACELDGATRLRRAEQRQGAGGDASDAGPAVAAALAERHVPVDDASITGRLRLDASASPAALVQRVEAWLDAR